MAIITQRSRVETAINFVKGAPGMYLAIGRGKPWEDEKNPPAENASTTKLDEVIGYKKVSRISNCRLLKSGEKPVYPTVVWEKATYVLVPENKAQEEKADKVYMEFVIKDKDLPLGPYRQIGLHTNLKPKSGMSQKEALVPSDVSDTGTLFLYENREAYNRVEDVVFTEALVVTFTEPKIV